MLPVARPCLESVKPYQPGKPIEQLRRELGLKGPIIKLASNENPLGPSPRALTALRRAMPEFNRYPEDAYVDLKEKLATFYKVDPESVILGNGSVEIIMMLCLCYLQPDDEIIMSTHSFLMARVHAGIMSARVVSVPETDDRRHDLEQMLAAVTPKTKFIYIDNPINPLGTIVTRDEFSNFMERVPEHVTVIYDEAYAEYITSRDYPKSLDYYNRKKNIVILRTFSKVHGLAGLRIGYGFAQPEVVSHLAKVRLPFHISRAGQAAAIAAIDDKRHILRSRKVNEAGKEYFYREFKNMPRLFYLKSYGNFVFINFAVDAREITDQLDRRGVITRPLHAYNLGTAVRVSVGTPAENKRFIKALREVLGP